MTNERALSEIEQLVLLALARLNDDAYGVTIRREIEVRGRRPVSIAGVYSCLERMEQRGLVESWLTEPTPERGGRAKKHFRLTAAGVESLVQARQRLDRMWAGLRIAPETVPATAQRSRRP